MHMSNPIGIRLGPEAATLLDQAAAQMGVGRSTAAVQILTRVLTEARSGSDEVSVPAATEVTHGFVQVPVELYLELISKFCPAVELTQEPQL
jgi:hypothetical protein